MKKLWVFGCSISDLYDSESSIKHWASQEYMDWKGYVPIHHTQIIAEKLECELINKAVSANSNAQIFQDFCDNVQYIKEDDFIIIQWSDSNRTRFVNDEGDWIQFAFQYQWIQHKLKKFSQIQYVTINEVLTNRLNDKYFDEIVSWEKLIKFAFNPSNILLWKPFEKIMGSNSLLKSVELIKDETNNEILDYHFSEKGQIEMSNILLDMIFNNTKNII
jgi:hypothetical protein